MSNSICSRVLRIKDVRRMHVIEEEVAVRPRTLLVKNICGAVNIGTTIHAYRGNVSPEHLEHIRNSEGGSGFECEAVAEVVEVGEGVAGFAVGDIIQNMGSEGARQFSVTTPETSMHIPQGVDLEEAIFIEQMRVALGAVRRARVVLGDSVLVVGCGIIGIAIVQLAKLAGAEQVIVSDPVDAKLAIAKSLGADVVINPTRENLVERVKEVTEARKPREMKSDSYLPNQLRFDPVIHLAPHPIRKEVEPGVDIIIDAANSPDTLQDEFAACRRFGKIVFVSYLAEMPSTLYLGRDFHLKQIQLVSSQMYVQHPGDFEHSMRWTPTANYGYLYELLKSRKLRMKDVITHRVKLEEAPAVFHMIDRRLQEVFGFVIYPNGPED